MLEKDIENLIAQYPDEFFPASGLKLIGQQVKLGRCYADIIFEDKYQRKIIIEVKRGILSRDASGQVMEYYGLLKTQNPTDVVELILCANVIPQERRQFLETVGIECKEFGINLINQIAQKVDYKFIDSQKIQEQKTTIKMPSTEYIWIFQANPQEYDILSMLDDKEVIKEFCWRVKQYRDNIHNGQIGLIWLSGKEAGIYAITEIVSNPDYFEETDAEKKYWLLDRTGEKGKLLRVKMKLIRNLTNNPILRETLKNRNELQNLSILKQAFGKNPFKVNIDEWELIKELIDN